MANFLLRAITNTNSAESRVTSALGLQCPRLEVYAYANMFLNTVLVFSGRLVLKHFVALSSSTILFTTPNFMKAGC
jgi:hypothetical protein